MPEDRIKLLEKINFIFNFESNVWEEKYIELINFEKENGHTKPAINRSSLGQWVRTQRKNYKNEKLSLERIQKLEKIETWFWKY